MKPTLAEFTQSVADEMRLDPRDERVIDEVNRRLCGHKVFMLADYEKLTGPVPEGVKKGIFRESIHRR